MISQSKYCFAIHGNHLIQRSGFSMGVGIKATYTVLDPIERGDHSEDEITEMCEMAIKKALGQE